MMFRNKFATGRKLDRLEADIVLPSLMQFNGRVPREMLLLNLDHPPSFQ